MCKLLEKFLPPQWRQNRHYLIAYQHSVTVANAAELIAARSNLDVEKAFLYGLMHDVGKFFVSPEEKYKHPRMGYELMVKQNPDVADVCIAHPFPDFNLKSYVLTYCHGDLVEARRIEGLLSGVQMNDYIELIQLCDKLSGIDNYVRLEDKFNWYRQTCTVDEFSFQANFNRLSTIKMHWDALIGGDLYTLLNLQKETTLPAAS